MKWDPLLVEYCARELNRRLAGMTLEAVHLDEATRTALLFLDGEALVLELHPLRGTLRLLPALPPVPGARPVRLQVLATRAPPDERLLLFHLGRQGSARPRASLVVELMTNQWNAVLLDRRSGLIRAVLWPRTAGPRKLLPGQRYQPPQPSRREGIEQHVPLQRWLELLRPVAPGAREARLLQTMAYTSRINSPVLLGTATTDAGKAADADLERGWARWCKLFQRPASSPCWLHVPGETQPYPFPLPELPAEPAPSLLEALARPTQDAQAAAPAAILDALGVRLAEARRRAQRLEHRLAAASDARALRSHADLILSRLADVPRGAREVTLKGFDGQPVRIAIDPALSPADNAAALYRRAARAERAQARLPSLIDGERERVRRLERSVAEARRGGLDPHLLGELLVGAATRRRQTAGTAPLPYRRFRTSGGLEVRVGRSARANDALTFHHSRPGDIWLHARDAVGAHVILQWNRPDNPPARDLAEAATLAALYSRARTSAMVPVDWTRRKYVRKPRRAPPGTVAPSPVRTIFVEPNPELAHRLAVPKERAG